MSRRPKSSKRMRLAKLSPVIALALLVALVFSAPLGWQLAGALLTMEPEYADSPTFEREIGSWAEVARTTKLVQDLGLSAQGDPSVEGMFDAAAMETWRMANRAEDGLLVGDATVPMPFAADSEIFGPVAAWEREHEARVWAWTVLPTGRPPLVASARARGVLLAPTNQPEPSTEASAAAVDDGGDSVLDWLWGELQYNVSELPALDPSMFCELPGASTSTDSELRNSGSVVADGRAYRFIMVMSIESTPDFYEAPAGFLEKDPRDADYDVWLERFATEHELDVWVLGPLESEAVALRVPEGADAAQAQALGDLVWPSMLVGDGTEYWYSNVTAPIRLGDDAAELAGAPYGALVLADYTRSPVAATSTGGRTPQTIAYLVALDHVPGTAPGPLSRVWTGFQRFVLLNFRLLFGAAVALLGVTLVISPTAFVIDRRRRARERAAEERERMRRDAHDKVFNRLSALSKRVAQVSDTALNGTGGSLASIAEDIRSAVAELQEILGDDVNHTSSSLTSVPLADQLAAVCGAQAARLGIEITCTVASDLPGIAPALGWDLQCITEEAINNAARHGSATRVTVSASQRGDALMLAVSDNGTGSAVRTAEEAPAGSTGLRGMRDRLGKHGGQLSVESREGGTAIRVTVPVDASCGSGEVW